MTGRLEKGFMLVATGWGMFRIFFLRPQVVVYANDMLGSHRCDPRMASVFAWLDANGVRYLNLVHAPPHGHAVRFWWRRARPVVYLDALGEKWLLRVLRICGARHLWALDDYRYWPRVIASAKRAGMNAVLFQHGRFTEHQSYLALPADAKVILPDSYIVWSRYWEERLIAVSPLFAARSDVLRVGGKAGLLVSHRSPSSTPPTGKLKILVVHEPAAPPAEVHALLLSLSRLPDTEVFYKVRGDQSEAAQTSYLGGLREKIAVTSGVPSCDIALGSYSTLLYELIERGVPVGVVRLSSMQAGELAQSGLATLIDPQDSKLSASLRSAADISSEERSRRSDALAVKADIRDTLKSLIGARRVINHG